MQIDKHQCTGKWELIPELSFYQEGEPPLSAQYEISVVDNEAKFALSWTQQDGQEITLEFGGIADGLAREVDLPPGATASYTIINTQTLDSAMLVDGMEMAYARRIVSNDNELMAVLQSNAKPDETRNRITQVYRRIA